LVNIFLSALAGALLTLAFEPVALWWFAPIALFLHMYALARTNKKVLSSFIFALIFNALLLHWTSTFVGSTPWLILSLGLSLFYLPLALVSRLGIGAYPFIFIALEEVRNRFPFGGFGWGRIAYSQADSPYAAIAARGGAIALSAMTLLLAAFLYFVFKGRLKLLLVVPLFSLLIPNNIAVIGQTSALMVQGNVPELGLDFNSRAKAVFNNHYESTKRELAKNPKIDFILWPENSVDVDPFTNLDVKGALDSIDKPLIIGAVLGKGNKFLNTSILWGGELPPTYVKQHLTPFGEYIPLRKIASAISPYTDRVTDFEPGQTQVIFKVKDAVIAPIICYELIDDQILHEAAISSNLLAVQTNSATFGMSAESAQQLSITRIRAIEHSRNILSVSTTGYSAVISYKGKVEDKTSMATAQNIYANVGLISDKSVRDRVGGWAGALTFSWLILVGVRLRRYSR
jgi:apolipoprotein N-acyltransferase